MAKQSKPTFKVPKQVGGIKLNKSMRKNLRTAFHMLNSTEGRALLGSAAGAIIGSLARRRQHKGKHAKA